MQAASSNGKPQWMMFINGFRPILLLDQFDKSVR